MTIATAPVGVVPAVRLSSFGVAKVGNTDLEWEDAAAHSEATGRFAVSDGAGEAYAAAVWSNLLVRAFLREPFDVEDPAVLGAWLHRQAVRWQRRTALADDAPFYEKAAQERGSHATLLAVELRPGPRWTALAIGDTCLLHHRDGELIDAFPIADPDAFDFSPHLVSTERNTASLAVRSSGELRPGDVLLGATDAASEWLLRRPDGGAAAAAIVAGTDPGPIVAAARERGEIRNDDIAIVRCVIGPEMPRISAAAAAPATKEFPAVAPGSASAASGASEDAELGEVPAAPATKEFPAVVPGTDERPADRSTGDHADGEDR